MKKARDMFLCFFEFKLPSNKKVTRVTKLLTNTTTANPSQNILYMTVNEL